MTERIQPARSRAAFKTEDLYVSAPTRLPEPIREAHERVGRVVAPCECGGVIDTNNAGTPMPVCGGLIWLGVPCTACDATYTVDSLETLNV